MTAKELELLDISWAMLVAVVGQPSRLEALRSWAKSGFQELALSTHPDRGGSAEQFHQATRLRDWVTTCSVAQIAALVGLSEFYARQRRAERMARTIKEVIA